MSTMYLMRLFMLSLLPNFLLCEDYALISDRLRGIGKDMRLQNEILSEDFREFNSLQVDYLSEMMNLVKILLPDKSRMTEHVASLEIRQNQMKRQNEVTSQDLKDIKRELSLLKATVTSNEKNDTSTTQRSQPENVPSRSRSRLLIAKWRSDSKDTFQLDMNTNIISSYPFLNVTGIQAATYDSISNSIFFSRYTPSGIFSSKLESTLMTTLRAGIESLGLRVDQGRQLLFLTTYKPSKTVSRMATNGHNFTVLKDMNNYGDNPVGIDLDPTKEMVYFTNHQNLFSMTYDGRNLKTLHKGYVRGVTLDVNNRVLYFHDLFSILRRPLSGGNNVKVGTVSHPPYKMHYYNNMVFIADFNGGIIYVLYTFSGKYNMLQLKTVERGGVICLLP